jgi:hypothetical protein
LQPLIDAGRDALVCEDVEGLEAIQLRELHIMHNSDQDDIEVRRASEDVFRALENQRRNLQDEEASIQLVKASCRAVRRRQGADSHDRAAERRRVRPRGGQRACA